MPLGWMVVAELVIWIRNTVEAVTGTQGRQAQMSSRNSLWHCRQSLLRATIGEMIHKTRVIPLNSSP